MAHDDPLGWRARWHGSGYAGGGHHTRPRMRVYNRGWERRTRSRHMEERSMKIVGRMAVFPTIPQRIGRLHELAYNLWWTWNAEAQALYAAIDAALWARTEHNAVRMLVEAPVERLAALAGDHAFLARYDAVLAEFDAYMRPESTWFSRTYPDDA